MMHAPARTGAHPVATLLCVATCLSLSVLVPSLCRAEDAQTGAVLYAKQCASCHGDKGQGTADYPHPLSGDKSVRELTKLIDKTMPDGEPEKCVGADAEKVAAFIHQEFYSMIAQERNRPAAVAFSRLTVRQFENSVADLIGSYRGGSWRPPERGLHAEYFNLRSFDRKKRIHDRTDATVNFNFEAHKPEGFPTEPDMEKRKSDDIHDQNEFSIKWDGAVFAPETGDYEFIVESENGVRLYVNDHERPLFDAWVRSGSDKEYRGKIRLLGGRIYPLRLEFFRYKEPTASIKLSWKPPHGVAEIIPERYLSPKWAPAVLVLTTPFPPDDRSLGYERGNSVSKAWEDAVTMAALETSTFVVENMNRLGRLKEGDGDRDKKLREFCRQFLDRAYRRPISDEEAKVLVEQPLADQPAEIAVKRIVMLALMSPRFLYREAGIGEFDAYDTASWLSYALWDSLPDQQLLDVAKKDELKNADQIGRQVDRMLGDLRARAKTKDFFRQWLRLDRLPEIVKDAELFPGFDKQLVSDLRTSLDLFLDDVLNDPNADFRRLLVDDSLYMNGRLAKFYGVDLPEDAPFQKVALTTEDRSGVLTHPLLLAGFAYDQASSPIHRGVFIARSLLGRRLKAPPEAVAPLAPALHGNLSTRERVLLQTSPAMCQSCHSMINDLGFPLENFDAAGRFRKMEKDRPIVSNGSYIDRSGSEVDFAGSRSLAKFLVDAPEVHEAFVEQLFQYEVKQPIRAFGPNRIQDLSKSFEKNNCNINRLIREITVSSALGVRELSPPPAAVTATP